MGSPSAEILEILATHAGEPVDYVALFMFLNTVAGGHYEERYTEAEIRHSLGQLLKEGAIQAWEGERQLTPGPDLVPGETRCHYQLRLN